jgi:hypothetical protein
LLKAERPNGVGKVAGVKIEMDEEKWAGDGQRWLDLFMGRTADKLAFTLPSPTWNVASPLGEGMWWGRAVRERPGKIGKDRERSGKIGKEGKRRE